MLAHALIGYGLLQAMVIAAPVAVDHAASTIRGRAV
jgi:hypothetical protein